MVLLFTFFMLWSSAGDENALAESIMQRRFATAFYGGNSAIGNQRVHDIELGPDELLWLITDNRLYRFDGYFFEDRTPDFEEQVQLRSITFSSSGKLYAATSAGLYRIDPVTMALEGRWQNRQEKSGDFRQVEVKDGVVFVVGVNGFYRINGDRLENASAIASFNETERIGFAGPFFWVSTRSEGLFLYHPVADSSLRIPIPRINPLDDRVSDAFWGTDGTLWSATYGGVLTAYNAETGNLTRYDLQEASGIRNEITRLHAAPGNSLWIGTQQYGLMYFHPETGRSQLFFNSKLPGPSLPENHVVSLWGLKEDELWVGLNNRGLVRFDLSEKVFEIATAEVKDRPNPALQQVWSILVKNDSEVLLGTGDGMARLDRGAQLFRPVRFEKTGPAILAGRRVTGLIENGGQILAGTIGSGLVALDASLKTARVLQTGFAFKSVSDLEVFGDFLAVSTENGVVLLDKNTLKIRKKIFDSSVDDLFAEGPVLWMATSMGLLRYDNGLSPINAVSPSRISALDQFLAESVLRIQPAGENRFALITLDGLYVYLKKERALSRVRFASALPPDLVWHSLSGFDSQDVWAGTSAGIVRLQFDPDSLDKASFDLYGGHIHSAIQSTDFAAQAVYADAARNEIFLGGIDGLNAVHIDRWRQAQENERFLWVGYRNSVAETDRLQPLVEGQQLTFTGRPRTLAFYFTTSKMAGQGHSAFKFRLVGFEDAWGVIEDRNYVVYTNLAQGNYTLEVVPANSEGQFSSTPGKISIAVVPPLYARGWFILLLISGLAAVITVTVRWRIEALKRQNQLLDERVRQRTEELRKSQEIFRVITEKAADLIALIRKDGQISYASPSFAIQLGRMPEEAGKTSLHELAHPSDAGRIDTFYKDITQSGVGTLQEIRLKARGFQWKTFTAAGTLLEEAESTESGFVVILHDISQRKRVEDELKRSKNEAEKANRAKSAFLAAMSHELRTPLNAIIGYSQILENDQTLSGRQRGFVDIMYKSGNHLLNMINDILDLSKIEAGRMELVMDDFDLHSLLLEIVNLFRLQCQQKGLELIVERDENVPRMVVSDHHRLKQILINVLSNAVKYTERGEIRFMVRSEEKEDRVMMHFAIKDTGRGIPEDQIESIFKPFKQVRGQHNIGTGLGLTITESLAKMMGGGISVTSRVNIGSTFTVSIPVARSLRQHMLVEPVAKVKKLKGDRLVRVLVVDDIEYNVRLLMDLLEPLGFICFEAVNGEQAIQQFETLRPDIILMDLHMPKMRGEDAMKVIRRMTGGDLPIVAVTASALFGAREQSIELGFDDFIKKPFHQSELLTVMQRLLGLEYEHESDHKTNGKAAAEGDALERLLTGISSLPVELSNKIRQALELSDFLMLESILDELLGFPAVHQILYEAIRAKDYRFLLSIEERLDGR